jgi:hypothetical protein
MTLLTYQNVCAKCISHFHLIYTPLYICNLLPTNFSLAWHRVQLFLSLLIVKILYVECLYTMKESWGCVLERTNYILECVALGNQTSHFLQIQRRWFRRVSQLVVWHLVRRESVTGASCMCARAAGSMGRTDASRRLYGESAAGWLSRLSVKNYSKSATYIWACASQSQRGTETSLLPDTCWFAQLL